ncbi:MAG: ATP-binding protein, partial [Rikenellaceae bacterium]|nr:ATP-binding protein [Rikenellaceae bacterium]
MSDRIKVLPDLVSNQIAAGEVVESPATAIKELLENAVDAGSTSVTLNFRNSGKELIQIKDNGCGMSPIDARLAFDRHATSKITSLEDIDRLGTFGFRGEAL